MRSYYCPDASAVKIDDAPKTKDEALKAPPIVFNAAEGATGIEIPNDRPLNTVQSKRSWQRFGTCAGSVGNVPRRTRLSRASVSAVMEDMEQLRDGLCRRVKLPWESVASEEHKTALDHWDFVTRVTDMYRREYVIKDGILRDVTVCTPSGEPSQAWRLSTLRQTC